MFVEETITPCKAIRTSNHMFGRTIWDKLPKCNFQIFENAQVKQGQFQNFQESRGWFIPNIARSKHVVIFQSQKTNKHFVSKLVFFNSGQLQISERAVTKRWTNNKVTPLTVQCWLQSMCD